MRKILIKTNDLSSEKKKQIKEFLKKLGVEFFDKENDLFVYHTEIDFERDNVREEINDLNGKVINLAVKAAIPDEWIQEDETLDFTFSAVVEETGDWDQQLYLDEKELECTYVMENSEKISKVFKEIVDEIPIEYYFDFVDCGDRVRFNSEQEKIVQVF